MSDENNRDRKIGCGCLLAIFIILLIIIASKGWLFDFAVMGFGHIVIGGIATAIGIWLLFKLTDNW